MPTPCQYCEHSIHYGQNEEYPCEFMCNRTTPKADACRKSGYQDFEVSEDLREVMQAFPDKFAAVDEKPQDETPLEVDEA